MTTIATTAATIDQRENHTESQADVVRRYVDAFNARDLDAVAAIIHPDFVDRHVPAEVPKGPEGVAVWWKILAGAFTLHLEIEDMVDAGDRVATRATLSGTHIGEFAGIPATGRDLDVTMMSIERFADGQIIERWEVYDGLTMLAQLGVEAGT